MPLLTRAAVMERFGISYEAADAECRCNHPRWEHDYGEGPCLHADHVGDWGEYNVWCRCNGFSENPK
jgi:hypothetical protein